jgi:hypothetical protein
MLTERGTAPENIKKYNVEGGTTYSMANYKKPTQKPVYQPNEAVDFNATKGKKEPIIVNDKNDPRLKAYTDSLKLYNSMQILGEDERGGDWEDEEGRWTSQDPMAKNYKPRPKEPTQPIIYQKINKKQVDAITPLGLTKPDVNEPKLLKPAQITEPTTSRVQDARTYTGAKYLEKMKRPTKYINTGTGDGREEFAMGGNLNFYTNQIAQEDAMKQMLLNTVMSQVGNAKQGLTKAATMGIFGNGGKLTKYEGNTHENGGIPIGQSEVEHGETNHNGYIFSDRLMLGKKSFAQLSKDIDKRYSKRPDDKISIQAKERELNNLIQLQESTGMTNKSNGGYANGGYYMNLINKMNKYNANDIRGNKPRVNTLDKNIARQDAVDKGFGFQPEIIKKESPALMTPKGLAPMNTIPTEQTLRTDMTNQDEINTKPYQMDQVSPWWLAASNVGNIANLAMSRPGNVNLQRVKPKLIDTTRTNNIITKELRDQANASSANIRGTANTAGTFLASEVANRAKTNSIVGSKIAQSNLEALNTNAQILNNNSVQNAQIQASEQDLRQREMDASKTIKSNAISSIGNNTMQYGLDRANVNMTNKMMNYITPQGYELVEAEDGTIKTVRKKGSGSTGINFKSIS